MFWTYVHRNCAFFSLISGKIMKCTTWNNKYDIKRETVGEAIGDPWQISENFFCLKAEKNFENDFYTSAFFVTAFGVQTDKRTYVRVVVLAFRHWSPAVQSPDPCLASSVSVAFSCTFFLPKSSQSTLRSAWACVCWILGPSLSLNWRSVLETSFVWVPVHTILQGVL